MSQLEMSKAIASKGTTGVNVQNLPLAPPQLRGILFLSHESTFPMSQPVPMVICYRDSAESQARLLAIVIRWKIDAPERPVSRAGLIGD